MRIGDYLKSLGNTADEVAESLREQGIKGVKLSKCHCPILNAIYKACPDYWSGLRIVNGNKCGDHWHYSASLDDCQIMDPSLPQPVMDFIGEFDSGKYPDLEVKKVRVHTVTTRSWD
jgi:hypothetical protein